MIGIAKILDERLAENFSFSVGCLGRGQSVNGGVITGIDLVDQATGGLQPGSLTVLAGPPDIFKGAFILQILHHVAVEEQVRTGYFCLTTTAVQCVDRLFCREAGISLPKMQFLGGMDEMMSREDIQKVSEHLRNAALFIDDTIDDVIDDFLLRIYRSVDEHSLRLVIVDYFELVGKVGKHSLDLSSVFISLKQLARRCGIPFLVVANGPRDLEPEQVQPLPLPGKAGLRKWVDYAATADCLIFADEDECRNRDVTDHVYRYSLTINNNLFGLSVWGKVSLDSGTMELREPGFPVENEAEDAEKDDRHG